MEYKEKSLHYNKPHSIDAWIKPKQKNESNKETNSFSIRPKPLLIEIEKKGSQNYIRLPDDLINIFNSIEKSKYILSLPNDWDGNDGVPYEKATWLRAIKFLAHNAVCIHDKLNKIIDTPSITHAGEGSIDIYWKSDKYQLLVNIPNNNTELASYYGENFVTKEQTEGYTNDSSFSLMSCLENLKQ